MKRMFSVYPSTRLVVLFFHLFSISLFARYEWVNVSSGNFYGTGMGRTKDDAMRKCEADALARFIQAAQKCCETTVTTSNARNSGRCSGDYRGPKANRAFDATVPYNFCYFDSTVTYMATGYVYVKSDSEYYSCRELRDYGVPTPAPRQPQGPSIPSPTYPRSPGGRGGYLAY